MKKIINLMLALILCIAFQCEDKQQISDVSKLCSYKNMSSDNSHLKTAIEVCTSDNFITELDGLTGEIQFNSELDGFIVVTSIDGTYDCQLIGVLCDDYENMVGKTVNYSGKFFGYHGSYMPPIGGQKIFVLKEFEYEEIHTNAQILTQLFSRKESKTINVKGFKAGLYFLKVWHKKIIRGLVGGGIAGFR